MRLFHIGIRKAAKTFGTVQGKKVRAKAPEKQDDSFEFGADPTKEGSGKKKKRALGESKVSLDDLVPLT